jgi:hypothetical protein
MLGKPMKLGLVFAGTLVLAGCFNDASSPVFDEPDANTSPNDASKSCIYNDRPTNVEKQISSAWLLTNPRIHLIFWGNWWLTNNSNQMQQISTEWDTIGNDPNFYQPVAEYGINPGQLDGIFTNNPNVPLGQLTESYIQTELQSEITNKDLPVQDSNSVYMIMFPSGTQAQVDVNDGFSGRHGSVGDIAYAYLEYSSNYLEMTAISTHEAYESMTDPNDSSGFNSGLSGAEIADLCEGVAAWSLDGYPIVRVWSQSLCQCVPVQ